MMIMTIMMIIMLKNGNYYCKKISNHHIQKLFFGSFLNFLNFDFVITVKPKPRPLSVMTQEICFVT